MIRIWFLILTIPASIWASDITPPSTRPAVEPAPLAQPSPASPIGPGSPAGKKPLKFSVERRSIPGGAELLTVFGKIPEAAEPVGASKDFATDDVPLIAVVRDTFGDTDPDNDQLRYVWVLTASRPTLLQRVAAATPFFYWRAGIGKDPDHVPSPVLDLSASSKPVWTAMAGTIAQIMAFDPNGALIRSSTRSYRNNARDHRNLHLLEGLAVLSQLENVPEVKEHLTEPELLVMQARLALASRALGGLVSDASLSDAYMRQRTRTMEERGHNWELLRQRAEANGLYFEPFGLGSSPTQALLWVAKEDLNANSRPFDAQFLNIEDPFHSVRLKNWTGYTQVRRVPSYRDETGETRDVELIPLALYSLDHPKVPLLLVDFRNNMAPKRREMLRHAFVDGIYGVAGYSRWSNWPYLAGSSIWNFVRARRGAANDRTARIQGYSQVRQWIAMDPAVDPALRLELQQRLERLGVNPLEDSVAKEAKFARRQYQELLSYVDDPERLASRIAEDRDGEAVALGHRAMARVGLHVAHYASLGIYTHRERDSIELLSKLDSYRTSRSPRAALAVSAHDR